MKLGRKELIGGSIIAFVGVVFLGLFVHFYRAPVYYQVIFDSKGGSEVAGQNVMIGSQVKTPSETVKAGYKFLGWYLGKNKFDFKTKVLKDITLKAKWEKIKEKKDTDVSDKKDDSQATNNNTTTDNSNNNNNNNSNNNTKKPEVVVPKKETPIIVDVSSVSLNSGNITLRLGGSASLVASVLPDNATDKTVTWTSSNSSVATVSNGTVNAVGAGTAIITATAGGKSASCTVTVTKPITYSYEIVDTPGSDIGQCDIYIKNSDGVRVSGTITIHYINDKDETVSVTPDGVRRIKQLIGSVSIVSAG